jgi:hypothetical protein
MSGTPSEYLANCSRLSKLSRELMDAGFCPINPAGDALEGLMSDKPMSDLQYKARSMDLLRLLEGKPAAVLIAGTRHRNGTVSAGVMAEVNEADRLGIPVITEPSALLSLRKDAS